MWSRTVVRAKGEEEAEKGYSGGVVGVTLCLGEERERKKFMVYHGWLIYLYTITSLPLD